MKLVFTTNPLKTRMFGPLGKLADYWTTHNMAFNSHTYSIDPKKYETDKGLA